MPNHDTRWKQRFSNFSRSYQLLVRTSQIENLSEAERAGLIQFFEMSFELAWKLLKDYLTAEGYEIKSPRSAIKQAFQIGIISDGTIWLQALEDRNLTTHTYDENTAETVEQNICQHYLPILTQLHTLFDGLINNE